MFKLIVLDRDGVINEDSPLYIKSPDEWCAIPGSLEAIAKLNKHGYKVVIATNQSGIARRYFTSETLDLIHKKMIDQVTMVGGHIDGIFICPHGPKDNCECRKPKSGLLLKAAQQFNVDPKEMLVIGDSMRDILAAKACGAAVVLVRTGKGEEVIKTEKIDVPVFADLAEVVDLFITKN
jgi:D-glycero-D-manno-heptose 1,7-bisphosphate phosphatase